MRPDYKARYGYDTCGAMIGEYQNGSETDGQQEPAVGRDEETEMDHDDKDEEAPQPNSVTTPVKPSMQELRDHELTHLPYRAWCERCVRSRAIEGRHRRTDIDKERETMTVTTFALGYMYLTEAATLVSAGEARRGKTKLGRPILVEVDRKAGGVLDIELNTKVQARSGL